MANTLFPNYQLQTGMNIGNGINGGVQYMSPCVPVSWSHNTHEDTFELVNSAQNQNRKPSDFADDGETELQGLVSNILDDTDSQDNLYSDGNLSQRSNNIWSPKILRDELLQYFKSEPKTQYSSNFVPNYTSHDAFDKAHVQAPYKEAEELCQAMSNGFNTDQHLLLNAPNGVMDIFSAQHWSHKPPPGLPLPNNSYMSLQQNNYDNNFSKERGNDEPMSSFPDLSHVFEPHSEMNGANLFCEGHYSQSMDKPAGNKQYASQDLNQLVNSFQSFVAGQEEACEFPNVSMPATMQHEGSLDDKWRSPSPFMRVQGNNSVQMQRQLGMDFRSALTDRNTATSKQLFKPDSLQDLASFSLQTTDYSPQAKLAMGHQSKTLLQRETAALPLNMNQFVKHQIQQSPQKFKPQMQKERRMAGFFGNGFNTQALSGDILPEEKHPRLSQNPFFDLPVSTCSQRFNMGSSQQFMPFIYAGKDPRRHSHLLHPHAFGQRSSLAYRVGVPSMDMGDMGSTNEMSSFSSGFNNVMSRGGEHTYHGLSTLVQMNQGGSAIQLFFYLDECYKQCRCLEKERKTTEIVLSKTFLGTRATAPTNSNLPKPPPNPSKVDHLIINQTREQARVSFLLNKMECLSGIPINANIYMALNKHQMAISVTSARRRDEINNMSHNQRTRAHFSDDKVSDSMLLVVALKDLTATTRKLRTAVWCALQMTLPKPVPRPEPPVSEEKPDEASPAQCGGYSYRL